ncbi:MULTISPECIES: ATP-binding protein [Capnocytophaga]|uniref:ATP-binding protein n=1 Tax=Capnocytophaga TaxID=1016 RepID=UPI0015621E2C|nr:ATP-binding protein [Capnocytophaga canis]
MKIAIEFKEKIRKSILEDRENYGGSDSDYAKSINLKPAIFSRLKKGEIEKIISDTQWLVIAHQLGVQVRDNAWKVARTKIYVEVEDALNFCQQYSKAMILVDDCGIGKTFCAKHISRKLKNAFYVDCSQAKTKQQFIRLLAKTIGVDNTGKYADVKASLKMYLLYLELPLIVLDEAGDLDYNAFLELKELWNATQGKCGWYMIGADGLRAKIESGIRNKKVGYAEIFDRFFDIISLVPKGKDDREQFYARLIKDVADANAKDDEDTSVLVRQCMSEGKRLRYLETLIKMQ